IEQLGMGSIALREWIIQDGIDRLAAVADPEGDAAKANDTKSIDTIIEHHLKLVSLSKSIDAAWRRLHPDGTAEEREFSLKAIKEIRSQVEFPLAALSLLGDGRKTVDDAIAAGEGSLATYKSAEEVLAARAEVLK